MPLHFPVDWKNADYTETLEWRISRLKWIREDPEVRLPPLKTYYADHPAQFIIDWGQTFDPREADLGRPTTVPFLLFPRQEEWVECFVEHWRARKPFLTDKSRDGGLSWLAVGTSATLCLLLPGIVAGFGSRKGEYVDDSVNPNALFWKAREFISRLPREFLGTWQRALHARYMRIIFPDTGSAMIGEAGNSIGRGGRTSFYFVDEAAHLEQPKLIDAALSATTNCRVDISSVKGMANPFAIKRWGGKIDVFTFHWRDDPRKDAAWYQKQTEELDPVTVAQEYDIDYMASVEGVVIEAKWARALVDSHKALGIEPSGLKLATLDVADEGLDRNAWLCGYGILVEHVQEWSGQGGDIFQTVLKAFDLCDQFGYTEMRFDSDGLGAGVRGDARVINEARNGAKKRAIITTPYRGSGEVFEPERPVIEGDTGKNARLNKDYFANAKAQAWWNLRRLALNTYRAVVEHKPFKPDEILSISSTIAQRERQQLITELSQATYSFNTAGKMLIDKAPDGTKSPNMADAMVIRYARLRSPTIKISTEFLANI